MQQFVQQTPSHLLISSSSLLENCTVLVVHVCHLCCSEYYVAQDCMCLLLASIMIFTKRFGIIIACGAILTAQIVLVRRAWLEYLTTSQIIMGIDTCNCLIILFAAEMSMV